MANPKTPASNWDYSDKVLEILKRQKIDEATKKELWALFSKVEADIKNHIEIEIDQALEEIDEINEAEKAAESQEESAEEIKRRVERARKEVVYEAATNAVDHLRALRELESPIRHNKWRKPNAKLTPENIGILGLIAHGGFSAVYLIENTDTKIQYAMKLQAVRIGDDDPMRTPPEFMGAPTPPITPSSEATRIIEKEMRERHLLTKRYNETKCYLQYIRSSHPFICNLEAFFDLRGGGKVHGFEEDILYTHIFEYCDWGTLDNVVRKYYETPRWGSLVPARPSPEGMPKIYKHAAIPEAFIWHVYMQSMEALAFLHGDHEFNREKKEFHRRNQIVVIDLKLDNIFLKSSGKPDTYPDVKLADFGEATYVPHGETRWKDYGTAIAKPPEEPWMSSKYDVWCMGICLHLMSHSNRAPVRPEVPPKTGEKQKDLSIEPKWSQFDPHLSAQLCKELERPREMNVEKRWTAYELWKHIKPLAEARIPLLYRPLQPWAKPKIDIEFDAGYLDWVEQGGILSQESEEEEEEEEEQSDESDESDESDDQGGGGGGDGGGGSKQGNGPSLSLLSILKAKQKHDVSPEEQLKRRREEEEQEKENLPPERPKRDD